jgi:hypothetical protein
MRMNSLKSRAMKGTGDMDTGFLGPDFQRLRLRVVLRTHFSADASELPRNPGIDQLTALEQFCEITCPVAKDFDRRRHLQRFFVQQVGGDSSVALAHTSATCVRHSSPKSAGDELESASLRSTEMMRRYRIIDISYIDTLYLVRDHEPAPKPGSVE